MAIVTLQPGEWGLAPEPPKKTTLFEFTLSPEIDKDTFWTDEPPAGVKVTISGQLRKGAGPWCEVCGKQAVQCFITAIPISSFITPDWRSVQLSEPKYRCAVHAVEDDIR